MIYTNKFCLELPNDKWFNCTLKTNQRFFKDDFFYVSFFTEYEGFLYDDSDSQIDYLDDLFIESQILRIDQITFYSPNTILYFLEYTNKIAKK